MNLDKYKQLMDTPLWTYTGIVTKVVGMAVESLGPKVNIGTLCTITGSSNEELLAEVVGFNGENILLMPLGDLSGVGPGCIVKSTGEKLQIKVTNDLLGQVVDWQANPLDETPILNGVKVPLENTAPNPLTRNRIHEQMTLGVKAIDGMLSVGKGQRMGIFAGSGVGKSTLMGMIARNALSDINVIALIGERGREVREFIEKDLQ